MRKRFGQCAGAPRNYLLALSSEQHRKGDGNFESCLPSHALTDFQEACDTDRGVFGLFLRTYDIAYRWLHGLTDPAAAVGPALRVEVRRYGGPAVTLSDGTHIRCGDRIGVLHLNNEHVAALHGGGSESPLGGLRFRRSFVASLGELARRVVETERYAEAEAFMAETILHSGTQRAGFDILRLRNPLRRRLVTVYERVLLGRYHPPGSRRTARPRFREARAIWISRKELLRRYAPASRVPSDTSS